MTFVEVFLALALAEMFKYEIGKIGDRIRYNWQFRRSIFQFIPKADTSAVWK
jgi:hypothetical protein